MNYRPIRYFFLNVAALAIFASPAAKAQFFEYSGGEVLAGFRKTGAHQGNYELVVNLGNVTNFLALAPGSSLAITAFSPTQLADAFPDSFEDLQWSAFCSLAGVAPWPTPLGSFPASTLWYTLARSDPNLQSQPEERLVNGIQASVQPYILGIGGNAVLISQALGTTNTDNNSALVRESVLGNSDKDLTSGIGDGNNSAIGDFGGQFLTFSVENTTPEPFAAPVRSDFYQSVPASIGGREPATYTDPITKLTNGPAYFMGYFQLNPDGTMSFTRASTNAVVTPPPAPQLAVSRSGGSSTISFATFKGATYTLCFTNAAGLSSPTATWPSLPGQLTGTGTSLSFQDAAADANRFYRVKAQ
jgi:hypothetical protein